MQVETERILDRIRAQEPSTPMRASAAIKLKNEICDKAIFFKLPSKKNKSTLGFSSFGGI